MCAEGEPGASVRCRYATVGARRGWPTVRCMTSDPADPNQVLLLVVITVVSSILSLVLLFLLRYWIIRLAVYHGVRS